MVRYAFDDSKLLEKSSRSRGQYLRVHFKNTRETAAAVSGMNLQAAYKYLDKVVDHQSVIPFRRFNGGVGRTPQANEFGTTQGRWPVKSIKFLRSLLKNAEANAEAKGLDTQAVIIKTIGVQQAPKTRRRTYRAHGRINAYNGHPVHVEVHLVEPAAQVEKAAETGVVRLNKRQLVVKRIAAARAAAKKPAQA
ncbi:60S ribosomal protein L17B [Thecaphora frezii]